MPGATTLTLLIRRARLATMTGAQASLESAPLGLIDVGALAIAGRTLAFVGPDSELDAWLAAQEIAPGSVPSIDAAGQLVSPGLVDCHTHLLFAGDRGHEHALRLRGATYLEIAEAGGGIRSTVRALRQARDEDVLEAARERVARMVRSGVTTLEAKSGYGLSVSEELRALRLLRELGEGAGCEIVPTLLGLHAAPPDLDRAAWLGSVVNELIPEAARQGLAHGCDAFLEQGAFDARECRAALEAGARAGLILHLHADQLTSGQGAELAASLGCANAGHLEHTTEAGALAMARAQTCAVLLPLAAWFLRDARSAQARLFLEAGCTVALASNLNPGSQRIESVSMLLAAGCLLSGLSPAQALWAMTRGGAQALRKADRGQLVTGLRADFVLWDSPDADHLPYHAGVEHARLVVRGGAIVSDLRGTPPLRCG